MASISTKCFACEEPRELTKEHIIPQSIGGRLTAFLYCRKCNSDLGSTLDVAISDTFGHIAATLSIKRQRGTPQPFEVEEVDTKTKLLFDGRKLVRRKPIVKYKIKEDGKTLDLMDVTGRSQEERDKIMRSLKTKYTPSGEEKTWEEHRPGPIDTMYEGTFDTTLIRRALTKMVYSLLSQKIPSTEVFSKAFDEARAYIRFGTGRDLASANFVHTHFMCDYTRPLHKIHISFDRRNALLVGYVMIFGIFRFTVLLSKGYCSRLEWPCLDYTYDPAAMRVIAGNANFRAPALSESQILRPKQSKQLVRQELIRCHKILERYVEGYRFLDIEI